MRVLRHRKHTTNGSVFFLFLAVIATVLLASVIVMQTDSTRLTVGEFPSLDPDFGTLLPSGSVYDEESIEEVLRGPVKSSLFIIGHATARQSDVSVVSWDSAKGYYRVVSDMPLVSGSVRVQGIPEMTVTALGKGLPIVVLARGSSGVSRETIFLMVLSGERLVLATLREAGYVKREAVFHSGPLVGYSEEVMLFDVDGDGVSELVVEQRGSNRGDDGNGSWVYSWRNGGFVLDNGMSWALRASTRIFPQPEEAGVAP